MAQKTNAGVSKDDAIHAGDVMTDALEQIKNQDQPPMAIKPPSATRSSRQVADRTNKPDYTDVSEDSADDVPIAERMATKPSNPKQTTTTTKAPTKGKSSSKSKSSKKDKKDKARAAEAKRRRPTSTVRTSSPTNLRS